MSVETRAYFVQSIRPELQIYLSTVDIGALPDRIDDLFEEIKKSDNVDFYTMLNSETRGHMTKRHRDMYGNPMRVAHLKDIIKKVKEQDVWCDNGVLFKDMCISLSQWNCDFLIFIEQY